MTGEQFTEIVDERLGEIRNRLIDKAEEYATDDDRLHNFRKMADLQGITLLEAAFACRAKHTISVSDLVARAASGEDIPLCLWIEKLGDEIAYNLLIEAILREGMDG